MQKSSTLFIILILFITSDSAFSSNLGCKEQLKAQKWPLDCLIDLNIRKTPSESPHYLKLDKWCKFFKEELSAQGPPEAFFSLYSPPSCKRLAQRNKKALKTMQIIDGSFLNSFL